MKSQPALLSIAMAMVAAALDADVPRAQESRTLSPQAMREIAQVEAEIDRIEAQTIERLAAPPDNQVQQIELLGKLMLYDKQLSVNRNEACAFCHMPEAGFTGPVSELNRTTGCLSRLGAHAIQRTQAANACLCAAVTGAALQSRPRRSRWRKFLGHARNRPAARQPRSRAGKGPPTNPVEMGLPDIACAVYRASQRPYRALFEKVWGHAGICDLVAKRRGAGLRPPGPPPAADPTPVHLDPPDRGRVGTDLRPDGAVHRGL